MLRACWPPCPSCTRGAMGNVRCRVHSEACLPTPCTCRGLDNCALVTVCPASVQIASMSLAHSSPTRLPCAPGSTSRPSLPLRSLVLLRYAPMPGGSTPAGHQGKSSEFIVLSGSASASDAAEDACCCSAISQLPLLSPVPPPQLPLRGGVMLMPPCPLLAAPKVDAEGS